MRAALLGLLLLALGCARAAPDSAAPPSAPAPVKSTAATLILTADLRGYLAPCGCSENMRGGIARAAQVLAQARQEGPPLLLIDAGDALFGLPPISPEEVGQEELKARALSQAFLKMGIAAHAVGPLDVKRGEGFERSLGLPDLVPGIPKLLDAGGHPIAVVSGASQAAIASGAKAARAQGAQWVAGLFLGSWKDAQTLAAGKDAGVDLLVSSHAEEELDHEESHLVRAATPLVALQSKGRSLLRVDLSFGQGPFQLLQTQSELEKDAQGLTQRISLFDQQANLPGLPAQTVKAMEAKIASLATRRAALLATRPKVPQGENAYAVRFLPLEATLPQAADVAAIVHRYDQEVGQVNLAWARAHPRACPQPAPGQASYVGTAACAECHPEAFAFYRTTKHAHAYVTLAAVGKQYRVDCVRCHVTGYDQPGGACGVDRVEARKNVGCEACHGPGSIHADDPSSDNVRAKPGREVCVGCHNQENSPHFDFALYLPQILGKGHGGK